MKLRTIGKKVIVRYDAIEKTESSIFILDKLQEKPDRGTVIYNNPESEFNIGDIVIFGKFAGSTFKFEDEELLVLDEESIIGVLNV